LGGNELTRVPAKALSFMENLRKLEMQENSISVIEEEDFEGTVDLFIIDHKFQQDTNFAWFLLKKSFG